METTILNLNDVMSSLNYLEILRLRNNLLTSKDDFVKQIIKLKALDSIDVINEIITLNNGLIYIKENIKVLEKALDIAEMNVLDLVLIEDGYSIFKN